jgi:hypothetical protein
MESAPDPSPAIPPAPPSWRKRHPVGARVLLYGCLAATLGGGAWGAAAYRRESRRQAQITRLQAVEDTGTLKLAPAMALAIVRDDVLATAEDEDVVRRAHLLEAAALDGLARYDEAERVYAAVAAALPAATPRGPVVVPWANMRINAGRRAEARALLAEPRALEGWPAEGPTGWRAVRARAEGSGDPGSTPGAPGSTGSGPR